ncbi:MULTISPECIES: catabolite control protein A [Furfurilactobacillus]|jgi:LacI family transcriptional regulator|uniref:Catabolite control protein A n=1 Tax=Furfurilactobacillus milii TaxID=2888272 RepID=A0ABT6DEK2_9LACO|nr:MULTISPECIES: catabolite control protein A [Furfurilactobacillus]QLE66830.1 Catabolite control protein A [Furfurilactobacillus rossiae]MCF6162036.1 catabolite control protein A [Furfurilactobacillus milii]MCF6164402.1 catabolite control protein A [Furfurilactobacillus milii]MCF6420620.1 catabolite control protein A [Furfurilactobacillus milii]MCH4011093.1 catabolite control protein A [Furfurilactobacillus sp.]
MDKQTVTIYDVAREAAVSMATVSRVVNGNPNVKPATRQKVLDVIDQLDYRPNAVARGLASKKTTTIGVIIPDLTNSYFSELARGIDDVALMYKYNIILASSDENHDKELQVVDNLTAKQVDGIIFMGNQVSKDLRDAFNRANAPIVFAGSVDPEHQSPSVNIDYVAAVTDAVAKLVGRGNRRIAFVTGSMDESINKDYRLKGYKQALSSKRIGYDEGLIFQTDYSYKAGYALAKALQDVKATAAFVGDDELAAGVLNGLTDAGVKVPEDFEIITSNDTRFTEISRPTMSSITQPLYDIGAVSMRLLTKLMNNEEIGDKTVVLPYGLKKRQSTK